jgi:hypothetical protein
MSDQNQIIITQESLKPLKQLYVEKRINPIQEDVKVWQNKAAKITEVKDDLTHRQASELRKELTSYINSKNKERTTITKPVRDFLSDLKGLEDTTIQPLITSKEKLTKKILNYEEILEKQRQAELARIAKIKQPFLVAELKPTVEKNLEMIKKVEAYFNSLDKKDQENPSILQACNSLVERIKEKIIIQKEEIERKKEADRLAKLKEAQDKEALELAKKQAEIDKQKREQQAEQIRLENEARQKEINKKAELEKRQQETMRVKTGLKERWTFEIIEPSQVPREYCEPSTKLINQAIKDGNLQIPGLKIFKVKG